MNHPFTRKESDPTDDLKSPLAESSIPSAIVKIVVAIAIPGGLYVLLALVVAPMVVRVLFRRAQKQQESETEKAERLLTWAIRLSRGSATALARRALFRIHSGRIDAALVDAEKALEKQPGHALAHYVRGVVFAEQENTAEAAAEFGAFLSRSERASDDDLIAHAESFIAGQET